MPTEEELLRTSYAAYNRRDLDPVSSAMTADVEWPDQLEDVVLVGRDAVRDYWQRQWSVFDPHVEPLRFERNAENEVVVNVHQTIRDLSGGLISDGFVRHIYAFQDGLVRRLRIEL